MQPREQVIERDYFNIVKGLGIFSVIIGHAVFFARDFVYIYHLPLFYFISGYMYNELKYGDDPFLNVKNKLKSTWSVYVIYMWLMVALHNTFYNFGLLRNSENLYTKNEIIEKLCNVVFGSGDELFGGPLWFLPVIVLASIELGFIVSLSRIIERAIKLSWIKFVFQGAVVLCGAIVAYPLIAEHYHFIANIQFTFEILPYLWVGYLLRNYGEQIDQYLNTVVGFICLGIVVYASRTLFIMDMTLGVVYPYMHLLGLSGIYVMMVLAKYLKKVVGMRSLFSYMGAHSLAIMIIHFVLLRLMDKVMCLVDKDVTGEVYSTLPVSYPNRWWAYLLVVVPTSVGIVKMIDFIKRKCIK